MVVAGPVYVYLDESSSLRNNDRFFIVAILVTDKSQGVSLKRIMKRARQKLLKTKLKDASELKFNNSRVSIREFVLRELSGFEVEIIALVINKVGRKIIDSPENYGLVVGSAVEKLFGFYKSIILYLDKRYTSTNQTEKFLQTCQEYIAVKSKNGSILFNQPVESKENVYIQLVDFVAGAFNYKYNRDDVRYVKLIEGLVKIEEVIGWKELKRDS